MRNELKSRLEEQFGGVYALFQGTICVYVGESENVPFRIREHMIQRTKEFDGFKYHFCKNRKDVEKELIEILRPMYNIKGNKNTQPLNWPTLSIFDEICGGLVDKHTNWELDKDDLAELFGCYSKDDRERLDSFIKFHVNDWYSLKPSLRDIVKKYYTIKCYLEDKEEPGQ